MNIGGSSLCEDLCAASFCIPGEHQTGIGQNEFLLILVTLEHCLVRSLGDLVNHLP